MEQTLRQDHFESTVHDADPTEIGPINMCFEIPMYNVSNLQVRYLRVADMVGYTPYRWVRYVTQSSSYVCRV
jgi:AP-4 complex subunit mu-1